MISWKHILSILGSIASIIAMIAYVYDMKKKKEAQAKKVKTRKMKKIAKHVVNIIKTNQIIEINDLRQIVKLNYNRHDNIVFIDRVLGKTLLRIMKNKSYDEYTKKLVANTFTVFKNERHLEQSEHFKKFSTRIASSLILLLVVVMTAVAIFRSNEEFYLLDKLLKPLSIFGISLFIGVISVIAGLFLAYYQSITDQ